MKNAGMAGAVALVGIGLITIGLEQPSSNAGATRDDVFRPFIRDTKPSSRSLRHPRNGDECRISIFEPVLRPYPTSCAVVPGVLSNWDAYGKTHHVDLLGLGTVQIASSGIAIFEEFCGGNKGPLSRATYIATPDGIREIEIDLSLEGPLDYEEVFGGIPCGVNVVGYMDVDGDGRNDALIKPLGFTNSMGWLRNNYETPARLPADLNHDGRVDGQDLGELFVQWTG